MRTFTPKEFYEDFLLKESIPSHLKAIEQDPHDSLAINLLSKRYRQLAVLEWQLHKDADKFKAHMKTSVEYDQHWIEGVVAKRGKAELDTHISPIFDAMITGDGTFLTQYVTFVDRWYWEPPRPLQPETSLYKTLVYVVLGKEVTPFEEVMARLKKGYSVKSRLELYPIACMLEAIAHKNEDVLNEQLQVFAHSYKKMQRRLYPDYEDQFLCMDGIALATFAQIKGMRVDIDHAYVPKALIGGMK